MAWKAGRKQDGRDAKAQRLRKLEWDWNCPAGVLPSKGVNVGSGRPPRVPWSPVHGAGTNLSMHFWLKVVQSYQSGMCPWDSQGGHRDRLFNPVMNRFLTLSGNTLKSQRSLLQMTHVGWGLQKVTGANEAHLGFLPA